MCLFYVAVSLTLLLSGVSTQVLEKPTFPDVFQVEVEGIFKTRMTEMSGSIYYDRRANRAAVVYTYQKETSRLIYNLNQSEFVTIQGNVCEVSEISSDVAISYIPFTEDVETKRKILAPPEAVFYFSNSTLDREDITDFPTYVYTATMDFPMYRRNNCLITHIFSKPEVELPDCESHHCKSTLVSISVECLNAKGEDEVDHTYNFYRFRSKITNGDAFQAPVGVHCDIKSEKTFPGMPAYFSFSYDMVKQPPNSNADSGVFTVHKKVWYDSKLRLIRLDEYNKNEMLSSSRIFDFHGGTLYTVLSAQPGCQSGPLEGEVILSEMTSLPKILFKKKIREKDAVYVGERKVHGMEYSVWSKSSLDERTEANIVEEFYFAKELSSTFNEETKLKLAFMIIYVNALKPETRTYELSLLTYVTINNFRSQPKEWSAFEIMPCFDDTLKQELALSIDGPTVLKDSPLYNVILEKVYMKLVIITNVSLLRISKLEGTFTDMTLTGFRGWILENHDTDGVKNGYNEVDMVTAHKMLEKAASSGQLSIKVQEGNKESIYNFAVISKSEPSKTDDLEKPTFPEVFQVEVEGIFKSQMSEMSGSIYYDRGENRAAVVYTYQNVTTRYIYNLNQSQWVIIQGNECYVNDVSSDVTSFFMPFTEDPKTKRTILAPPEEVFYFTNSTLDRQDISVFPSYVYTATMDFPVYRRKNCQITHIFSKPEMELPDCDGHNCKPTLVSISITCLNAASGVAEVDHTYNFYRFQSKISNEDAFQPPVGVHCDIKSEKPFPILPAYFSFFYTMKEVRPKSEHNFSTKQKKVWYDSKLRLIRIDEYDQNGLLSASRIFNIYGGNLYTIVSSLSVCTSGKLDRYVIPSDVTSLPKILFNTAPKENDAVYVGQRKVESMNYFVWSTSYMDGKTDAKVVEEFYFAKEELAELKLSHAIIYESEPLNTDPQTYELAVITYVAVNNFQSQPKEWREFDISACFNDTLKKEFTLSVDGLSTVKDSELYSLFLEKLYIKLIAATNISLLRISELEGLFDGTQITGFRGWILENYDTNGVRNGKNEVDMKTAHKLLEKAASSGRLSITVKEGENECFYNVTVISKSEPSKKPVKDCFSGGSLASAGLVLLALGIALGVVSYYVFLKKRRRKPLSEDKVYLSSLKDNLLSSPNESLSVL